MVCRSNEVEQLVLQTSGNVPSESEINDDLARRLKVLKSAEHQLSQYGQPLTRTYIEAIVWVVIAAIIWVIALNVLA